MSGHSPARLPAQVTSFVGRSSELEALADLVRSSRLVTITGPAGMGKTRLAIEVAGRLDGEAGETAHFVSLAALTDEAFLVQEVATRLSVPERGGEQLALTLATQLGDRSLLLVLDNCEHLVSACAHLVESLLRGCPNVRVLATSLQPLRVPGEVVWRIAPLSLPGRRHDHHRRPAGGSEAVRLFEDRARLVRPGFEVEPTNADAVAHVCRRLEGIPLAIELAAALMEAMSVQDVLSRLDARFRLLSADGRAGGGRHRTLHAALDWGHQLLDGQERQVFRRLAVFGGGFELAACEAVCAGDAVAVDEVGGVVFRLVERSLLQADLQRSPARYRLLEPIRQFAAERLSASGERPAIAERHAAYFLELAEESEREERGEDQAGWLARLETELDNLRIALAWYRARNAGAGLRMASALSWFWVTRGHYIEGRAWLETALSAAPADAAERAWALIAVARIGGWQADYVAAQRFCEEALELFDRLGELVDRDWTLTLLGSIHTYLGDFAAARRRFEEALASSDDELVRMEALVGLGEMQLQAGDLPGARSWLEQVASQSRGPDGPRGRAALFLGIIAVFHGDTAMARVQLAWSLEIFRRLRSQYGTAATLNALAALAVAESEAVRALRLSGAAEALRASIRSQLAPRWRELVSSTVVVPARAAAGDRADAAWAEGGRMSFDEAIRYARMGLPVVTGSPDLGAETAAPPPRAPAGLTSRELQIAELVAQGMTNRRIAERLVIAERTVEGHVERIRGKLGVHSRKQIAGSIMRERGWPGR
ncbi:MAG TPA: LuxR C-terminal-related transcriptional regulator [Terriglobales bacterium]|nr:LuxR C-terminal-related transcriptional regulator [Terriglobales bacterium]